MTPWKPCPLRLTFHVDESSLQYSPQSASSSLPISVATVSTSFRISTSDATRPQKAASRHAWRSSLVLQRPSLSRKVAEEMWLTKPSTLRHFPWKNRLISSRPRTGKVCSSRRQRLVNGGKASLRRRVFISARALLRRPNRKPPAPTAITPPAMPPRKKRRRFMAKLLHTMIASPHTHQHRPSPGTCVFEPRLGTSANRGFARRFRRFAPNSTGDRRVNQNAT